MITWAGLCYVLAVLSNGIALILVSRRVDKLEYRLQQTIETTSQALDNIGQMFVVVHERLEALETEAEKE